jgi:hypothetical protein
MTCAFHQQQFFEGGAGFVCLLSHTAGHKIVCQPMDEEYRQFRLSHSFQGRVFLYAKTGIPLYN